VSRTLGGAAGEEYNRRVVWLWMVIAVVGLGTWLFAYALLCSTHVLQDVEDETRALAVLGQVESPSGRPFFPTGDSLWDLAGQLEDLSARPGA
jgi:hypothetical protein